MLKKYNIILVIFFLFLIIASVYFSDTNSIFWSVMVFMFLVSTKVFDTKNNKLIKYESILFFIASIVLFLNTFTNVITEIKVPVIVVFTILYALIIFLKIREQKNKYNKENI
jgi:hypothetical protein